MKNLSHQQVCRLYHIIETSTKIYMVLEVCFTLPFTPEFKVDCSTDVFCFLYSLSTVLVANCLITSLPKIDYQRRRPGSFSDRSSLRWPTFIAKAMLTGTSSQLVKKNIWLWLAYECWVHTFSWVWCYKKSFDLILGKPTDWWRS